MFMSSFYTCNALTGNTLNSKSYCQEHRQLKAEFTMSWKSREDKVRDLRSLLASDQFVIMPCCYDGFTAKLIESAGG
jgi:hypothetical protein